MQVSKWIIFSFFCLIFHLEASASTVITSIPAGGITISLPGTYVFGNNITWSPAGNGQAIKITSSDVILDMQNFTLESATTAFETTGIWATTGSNVVIKNGIIANMGISGITCDHYQNVTIKNIVVDGLNLNDIILYRVPTGILVEDTYNAVIDQCTVKNIDVTTASMAAIQLTRTLSSLVSSCIISNLNNRDGACTGIGHLECDNAEVNSCVLNGLASEFAVNLNTAGHTVIGLIPVASTNLYIKNCSISNIVGCCDDAHGISLFECSNAQVENCHVENVSDGVPTQIGAKATGIEVYASAVKVINCSVKNITAINPQDKQATGFSCAQCVGVEFYKCQAENVNVYNEFGEHNPALGYGTGFGWAPDPRPQFIAPAVGILYNGCIAKNCQVGFDTWFHIDSLWKNLYSICNEIPILDLENSQRTISCTACSECTIPITVTIQNVARNNKFSHVYYKSCE